MADLGFIERELNALPAELRPVFVRIFRAILPDLRFGHPTGDASDPMVNFGGAFLHATTPAIVGTEFAITHRFGRTPYLAFPVLRLDAVGSSVGPFTVTQAADARRIFLSSTSASLPCSFGVEG